MHRYIGRLFLAALLALAPLSAPASARAEDGGTYTVIISEVGWAGSSLATIDEWIELTNLTDATVDLGGWTLAGAATNGGSLTLPAGSTVAPFQSFLISNYANDDARSALARAADLVTASVSLSNSALAVTLHDADGAVRDSAGDGSAPLAGRTAGGTGGDAGGDVGGGAASMVRTAPVADGTLGPSWTTAVGAAGFDESAPELGTPGSIEEWFVAQEVVEVVEWIEVIEEEVVEEPTTETIETVETAEGIETVEIVEGVAELEEPAEPEVADTAPEPEPEPSAPTINYPVGTLVVNEVVSDADEEWIEIYNPYNNVIPLAGWTVRDASGKAAALPEQLLGWDQYVVVRNPIGKLNNDGDTAELVDPNGVVIDAMTYGAGDISAAENPNALARDADGEWRVTTTPTPGSMNLITAPIVLEAPKPVAKPAAKKSAVKKTEARAAKTVADEPTVETWSGPITLRLSELYPNTSGGDLVEEFVEIENLGDAPVDLRGWTLSDASGRPHRFDASLVIGPDELLTLTRAETRVALNNTADSVTLTAPDGSVTDSHSYESPPKGSALVRADAQWVWTRTPTPDEPNVVSQDDPSGPEAARPAAAKVPAARVASASGAGRSVTTRVEGTVLVEPGVLGKQIFYVETETGGLQVYKYDASFPDLAPGDRVAVSGTMSENRGEPRLKVASDSHVDVTAGGDAPVPEVVSIAGLTATDHGRLIRVTGTVLSRSGAKAIIEHEGAKLSVRVAEGTGADAGVLAKGANLEIAGILVATESGITLLPRSADDLTVIPDESEQEAAAATVTTGKDAQASRDKTISLILTAGVVAGLGLYSSRRLIRAGKLWYAKSRALRAAAQTAH